ncbi:phosphoglycerate mutase [Betaproteobacteria bacterium]|nr:phosphoglycerate mutase [Betaproteobacteria bacterium]
MKPKRIILVRHGESEANVDREIYSKSPDHEIALTATGHEQSVDTGRKIAALIQSESYAVYVSPYARTLQTMKGICGEIAEKPLFVYQDPRLREQDWGVLPTQEETKRNKDVRDSYSLFFYRFPGGESCADVFDRMSTFFETLHRDFQKENFPENILIVSHGVAIKCFLARWFHWEVEHFALNFNVPNCYTLVMNRNRDSDRYELTEPFGKGLFSWRI